MIPLRDIALLYFPQDLSGRRSYRRTCSNSGCCYSRVPPFSSRLWHVHVRANSQSSIRAIELFIRKLEDSRFYSRVRVACKLHQNREARDPSKSETRMDAGAPVSEPVIFHLAKGNRNFEINRKLIRSIRVFAHLLSSRYILCCPSLAARTLAAMRFAGAGSRVLFLSDPDHNAGTRPLIRRAARFRI